jgi:hypothetical protein
MKALILLSCSLLLVPSSHSAPLSDADRESLLESLERLQKEAQAGVDSKLNVALSAYRSALASDQATHELYLNCLEKVNFVDKDKSGVDFAKWKRGESDKLSEPGLKLALRYQLRWLILTIQASSEKADRDTIASEAEEVVDTIFRDPEKVQGQQAILSQSVTGSLFATAYGIGGLKVEKWPLTPVELNSVYEELLFPRARASANPAGLRAAWVKRILQEGAKIEFFPARKPKGKDQRGEDRDRDDNHEQEVAKFASQTQPKLKWEMEVDLFKHGDEKEAALKMFKHLVSYNLHPAAKEWAEQLKELLTHAAPETPAEPGAPAEPKEPSP